jgi:hypothetical protein
VHCPPRTSDAFPDDGVRVRARPHVTSLRGKGKLDWGNDGLRVGTGAGVANNTVCLPLGALAILARRLPGPVFLPLLRQPRL